MRTEDQRVVDELLGGLDAADRGDDPDRRLRATALLERIVGSDPDRPEATPAAVGVRRRRRGAVLVAAAVAAGAVAVVGPSLVGGDGAFASWSPTPTELTGAERRAAVDACLVLQAAGEEGELAFDPSGGAEVLVAEARGGWSYVVVTVTGTSGRELQGSCLVPDSLVDSPRPGAGGFFGSLGRAEEMAGPVPGRTVAREDGYGVGSVDGEAFVFAEGRAGADVVGIEVTTPGGREVEASLDNGRWAAWWPAGDDAMDNPELTGAPTYTVTLRDGSVTTRVR